MLSKPTEPLTSDDLAVPSPILELTTQDSA
jgi:hypothetical protein